MNKPSSPRGMTISLSVSVSLNPTVVCALTVTIYEVQVLKFNL